VKLVIIESPFKGDNWEDLERNKRYLRACIRDCIDRDESPYASHRMLTDTLDDKNPVERAVGIKAGLAWRNARPPIRSSDGAIIGYDVVRHVIYIDFGYSEGMLLSKKLHDEEGTPYEERKLPADDPFFSEEHKMEAIAVRYSAESIARVDRIAKVLSKRSMVGVHVTRADAIRLAVEHGMIALEEALK